MATANPGVNKAATDAEDQINTIREAFNNFDSEKSGKISTKDLKVIVSCK